MLFYESAKCLHGRMRTLKGKYYGSLFVHYMPVENDVHWGYDIEDIIAAVPPHWNEGIQEDHGSRWAGQVSAHYFKYNLHSIQFLVLFACSLLCAAL